MFRKLSERVPQSNIESPQFKFEQEMQNSMPERGYLPRSSIQERGEEEDRVSEVPPKRIMRKKGFREISVSDIMPNLKSKLALNQAAETQRERIGFVGF